MSEAAEVVWEPTPAQSKFLACDELEVLYGGAAGGGKSASLVIDALCLQHDGINNPNHRAILFRRSFPELRDLIDETLAIYPALDPDAEYNQTEKVWTFSSGAKVEFGYLQHDSDRLKYRGRAWNYIGFDELTLWPTDVCYTYLLSRCRSTDPSLPRYVRATTNPDGPGQLWVMERWEIGEKGRATLVPVEIEDEERGVVTTIYRRFVPARLIDNPHLDGTGYREMLLQMPKDERDALLYGYWKAGKVQGAYYAEQMQAAREDGRIRRVPHEASVPVNTFWDLGYNDTTAIWFHQYGAGEHRFINYYENSGEALDHYAQHLLAQGYTYGTHYLPHDAENKSLQTGKSALDILEELLPGHTFEVVPRVENVLDGIQQTRMRLKGAVYIDKVKCADGIAALDNYRKKYNATLDVYTASPLHDRYSNGADAFRQWGQGYEAGAATSMRRSSRRGTGWRVT